MNAKQIKQITLKSNYNYFALRSMTPDYYGNRKTSVKVGQTLPCSYNWDDGNSTGEQLNGTCGIQILPDYIKTIERALAKTNEYDGNQVVLIGAYTEEDGADEYEVILHNAEVLAAWRKS